MEVKFKFKKPADVQPVVFEQIFAEKPGGGIVANPDFDLRIGTAVGFDDNNILRPIKGYRLYEDVSSDGTTIKIYKGSGVKVHDVIAHGSKAVAVTAVDISHSDYDLVTVSFAEDISKDTVLYQAKIASASDAEPIYSPAYILGDTVFAGEGDQLVKLVNGANIRKETANVADEVVALMKTINKV